MSESYGLIGALAALPRRLAERAVAERGGRLTRGTARGTTHAVFGRGLLKQEDDAGLSERLARERSAGRQVVSENGFLRRLELRPAAAAADLSREAVLVRAGIAPEVFDLLAILDAFESDAEPFSFRDILLARQYAGLVRGGAGAVAIARSVHRSGDPISLTAKALQVGADQAIYARHGALLSELDGQLLIPLGEPPDLPDDLFAEAQDLEASGQPDEAAARYARCLALDPGDAVAAFNCANCLRASARVAEAERGYLAAIKADPGFVEAWFNLAGLVAEAGRSEAARRHLERAVALDPDYGDAVFNLAALAFEAGDLPAARRWWTRYLELDQDSDWARTARRGLVVLAGQAAPAR